MSADLTSKFTRRYGVRHPFAGAAMAFVSETPDLAVAVTNAGGIGAVAVGFLPAEQLRTVIHAVREAVGDKPFNINFITCFGNDEQVRVAAEERVPIASFHWGHPPAEQLELLHQAGVTIWEQVGDIEYARRALDDGIEAIIAQGWEAGGHNYGGLPTFVLIPEMRDALGDDVMLLASGGISDGRTAAAALCLGADAVWVGTRLCATPEANTHPEHIRRILASHGHDTIRSSIFGPEMPHFNPMRLQRNTVVAEWTHRLAEVPTDRSDQPIIGHTTFLGQPHEKRKFDVILPTPDTTGDFEEMAWLMGQGVGLVHTVMPAAKVVEQMMSDASAILTRATT